MVVRAGFALGAAVLAFVAHSIFFLDRTGGIPERMYGNSVEVVPEILSEASAAAIRDLIKRMGEEGFPTNVDDGLRIVHEHIGEARPAVDGRCEHPCVCVCPAHERVRCMSKVSRSSNMKR